MRKSESYVEFFLLEYEIDNCKKVETDDCKDNDHRSEGEYSLMLSNTKCNYISIFIK